jgi:hypothetical protein
VLSVVKSADPRGSYRDSIVVDVRVSVVVVVPPIGS